MFKVHKCFVWHWERWGKRGKEGEDKVHLEHKVDEVELFKTISEPNILS